MKVYLKNHRENFFKIILECLGNLLEIGIETRDPF